MEQLSKLLTEHKEAVDSSIEPNSERIKLINSSFLTFKEEALLLNKSEDKDSHNFVDLEKVFEVCKKLSPTEGYWERLIITALYFPKTMSMCDIFDIGRFTERMFQYSNEEKLYFWVILGFKQRLQTNFSKKN